MTRSKFTLWLLACLILMFTASLSGAEELTLISKDQLRGELTKPEVMVVDVRAPHDWDSAQWKIQGARRLSPAEVGQSMAQYPKDKTIVFYCS
jgi:rhodanese-related sulfurtransferase